MIVTDNADVYQIDGGLQRWRGIDAAQDADHRVGVRQRVFAGVQRFAGDDGAAKPRARAIACSGSARRC